MTTSIQLATILAREPQECRLMSFENLGPQMQLAPGIQIETASLARAVVAENYGTIRLLIALISARKERYGSEDEIAVVLEELIKKGLY